MFDSDRIQRDREMCEAATKGPWKAEAGEVLSDDLSCKLIAFSVQRWQNTTFIATARTELPDALDEIVRLQKELAESQRREQAADVPDDVSAAAEHMFQTLCVAPPYIRELFDAVSEFWKVWSEWRGAPKQP